MLTHQAYRDTISAKTTQTSNKNPVQNNTSCMDLYMHQSIISIFLAATHIILIKISLVLSVCIVDEPSDVVKFITPFVKPPFIPTVASCMLNQFQVLQLHRSL